MYSSEEIQEARKQAVALAIVEFSQWHDEDEIKILAFDVSSRINRHVPHLRTTPEDVRAAAAYAAHYLEHDRFP